MKFLEGDRWVGVLRRWQGVLVTQFDAVALPLVDFRPEIVEDLALGEIAFRAGCPEDLAKGVLRGAEDRLELANESREEVDALSERCVDGFLDCARDDVVPHRDHRVLLADAVDTPDALFHAHRVPRQVVGDEVAGGLQVQPLAGRVGRQDHRHDAAAHSVDEVLLGDADPTFSLEPLPAAAAGVRGEV